MQRRILAPALAGLLAAALAPATPALTLGKLDFQPCDLGRPGTGATLAAHCATLSVPENPDAPDGRRIELRIGLAAARTADPAPDPVLYIAGGPGQSATETYAGIAAGFARLREKRHILFVDQRGTGGSHKLVCATPEGRDAPALPGAEAQVAMARQCLAGLDADVRQYTTSVAVRDLEAVRLAIGAPQLNLYGGSYGSRVAQEYARRHPGATRSLLLDGVVPPELALGSEHGINLEAALQAIFAVCAGQPACARAFGDPYRSLRTLRDRVRLAPYPVSLPDPLDQRPREVRLDADTVAAVARLYAYQPETAALLPLLVQEALQGRPQPLVAQAALMQDALRDQIMHGMQLSVVCAEDAPRLARRAQDRDLILGDAIVGITLNQCGVWPRGAVPADFHDALRSDVPALLLSGQFDPVTPPRYGEQVAKSLPRGRHLVGPGQGHIQLPRGCFPRLAAEFVDRLDAGALDAACLQALGPTPFFLTYNGAEP